MSNNDEFVSTVRVILGVTAIGIAGFLFVRSFEVVSPGHRGVAIRFGAVDSAPMVEGLNVKAPWTSVEEWSIQVQKLDVQAEAASRDLQTVQSRISINYRLNPELTPEIHRVLSRSYQDTVIMPAAQESVKAVIARYQAADLLDKRSSIREEIEEVLQTKLNTILNKSIDISALNIENFAFEKSFNDAIESKQVAEQKAQQSRNEVEQSKAEADKAIESARGRAESKRLEAQAQAEAILIEAEAKAKAITVEASALRENPNILRLRSIERWDGVMPKVVGNESQLFMSLKDLEGSK